MYYIRYVHQLIKQLNPVLIKIAIHYLNLYDWPLQEITSAIERLVTKKEKSFSSGRSCRPNKITVDYNYTLISEIFSWEVDRQLTGKKMSSNWYALLISRMHFCSLLHAVGTSSKLVFLLASYFIYLVTYTM